MIATEKITFRATSEDREVLEKLSKIVRRSKSDTIRWIVRETLKAFESEGADEKKNKQSRKR